MRQLWDALPSSPRDLDGPSALERSASGTALIDAIMKDLARDRPVFHSEADFQHTLACSIHDALPDGRVRLEYKPFPLEHKRMHLDIWLPDIGVAMELKYSTKKSRFEHNGEIFELRDGAPDVARYGFLKDIERLESLSKIPNIRAGFSVLLSNDYACWKLPKKPTTIGYAFRLHDKRKVTGEMAHHPKAAPGSVKGIAEPIHLTNTYNLQWQDYANLGDEAHGGRFRYLAIQTAY